MEFNNLGIQFSANFIQMKPQKKNEKQRGQTKNMFFSVIGNVIVNGTAQPAKNKTVEDDFTKNCSDIIFYCIFEENFGGEDFRT